MLLQPLMRKTLARELGVSQALVTKHADMGMPTHSVEAARAWRSANLREHMTKGHRITDVTSADAAVARVHRLVPIAVAAIDADRFDLVEPELRAALGQVPKAARESVSLDLPVWERLVGSVRDKITALAATPEPSPGPTSAADDFDAEDLGSFWYQVAAGERVWVDE